MMRRMLSDVGESVKLYKIERPGKRVAMTVSSSLASFATSSEEETAKPKRRTEAPLTLMIVVPNAFPSAPYGFDLRSPWVLMRSPCAPGCVETLGLKGPHHSLFIHFFWLSFRGGLVNLKTNMPRVSIVLPN